MTAAIVRLASAYGRYGYRRITALLRGEGWYVNHKRVERIWRREGLKVPAKGAGYGSTMGPASVCVRTGRTMSGPMTSSWLAHTMAGHSACRPSSTSTLGSCLAIDVARRLRSDDVLYRLAALFVDRGPPDHIRSDNGAEFTATAVREWLARVGVKTLYIEPGSPWGERLQRVIQRQAPGRAAQRRNLPLAQGGPGADRAMAAALQHGQTTQCAGLQTPGASDHRA